MLFVKKNIINAILLLILMPNAYAQQRLKQIFLDPPENAKPRGYWVWSQGNYDYDRINYELKEFKDIGLA